MLAILYDIHGNLPALEAVLDDARAAGTRRWLLGGDYAAFGAWPVECVDRLRGLSSDAVWIRGNWERWQGDPSAAPDNPVVQGAGEAVSAALGDAGVTELAALPASVEQDGTLFCHASPLSDVEPVPREADPDDDDKLLAPVTVPRLVFGHTHVQFMRGSARGIELVNPGSVGLPWDGDTRAAYALLDPDAGRIELRRVEYDMEVAARALDAIDAPWAAKTAKRLRAAAFEV
jgi:diadenosine tetraphosphatase ApaH/serine/threonine PP2A family protein phosphatase